MRNPSPRWGHRGIGKTTGKPSWILAPLMPFPDNESNPGTDSQHATAATPAVAPTLPITPHRYLALVDWTGRQLKPGKRGRIAGSEHPSSHNLAPTRMSGFKLSCSLTNAFA